MRNILKVPGQFLLLFLLSAPLCAQTIDLGGQQASPGKQPAKASGENLGWGASIEVGRNARAAEDALRRGDGAAAATFAQRAVKAAPQNARLWFLLGYASRLAGQYSQSIDAYQQGLKLDKSNLDGLSGLAQTYQKMGRLQDAKRILLEVVRLGPKRQNDLLMAGELFIETGDTQQGINLLSRAEAMQPSSHAEVMLAVAYLKLKQPERARQLLEQAKRRDPRNPAVFRAVANFYREQHDYKAAIAALKSAPGQNPDVLADLAYSYELDGDNKEAAATFARAADLAPKQMGLQLSAAQAQLRIGEMDKTRAYLGRAEQLDANNYRLHAIKAQLAKAENRNADAIREYQTAIAGIPGEGVPEGILYPIQLRLSLADLYRETGDDASAKRQIADAEQLVNKMQIEGPARAEFLRVRASIRLSSNDVAGAEADLKEALQLDPGNTNIRLQYANLLWRVKRKEEARKVYDDVLKREPKNRYALEAMGYIHREDGDNAGAERFFRQLAEYYPDDYVPYLALGDLYTSMGQFDRANTSYEQAYKLSPQTAVIVANASSAAIEAGHFPVATNWVNRAQGKMLDDPRVMRERERVLFHEGKYEESAKLGYQALAQMPNDRNGAVYLAYDLYNLGRYDDVLLLTQRYSNLLPKEPNFPLLTGHVHKQNQLLHEAVDDYTRVLERDPKMAEAYVNRGYVLNDLQNANAAIQDFDQALKLQPNNGVAHLGLAFAHLQLRHGRAALDETEQAQKLIGESGAIHLARATAYRDMRLLDNAEVEYKSALKYAPDDLRLRMALADTQYHARRYAETVKTLNDALALSPDDPVIYAQLASAHAELRHRPQTIQYVTAAEKAMPNSAAILLNTGNALLTLGDRNAAMQRFSRALNAPDANRVDARLLFARLFVNDQKFDDARQQIALAFSESRVGEASPVTADNFIDAANLFLGMSDFDLARRYFERAKQAGAADEVVGIGLANTALAEGNSNEAQRQLATLGDPKDYANNFDYTMVQANIYRQQHQDFRALTTFARANQVGGEDDSAELAMQQVAGDQGVQVSKKVSVGSDFLMHGVFDDATIYGLDRQVFSGPGGALPPPRSQLETLWTNSYHADLGKWPMVTGFFQVRNARGLYSLPNQLYIANRNTTDYTVNSGINPVLRLGQATFSFNTGLQYTWRRDSNTPVELNQNLFRQFVYMSSNALANWLTVQGEAYHESGPFTNQNLHSRELGARIEFIAGRPWGRTQLLTAYSVRDILYRPLIREFYSTSASVGVQHEFGQRLRVAVLGEYIRSWRVQDLNWWIAQAMRPAAEFEFKASRRWSVNGNFSYSRGEGFHDYDNVQSGFFISYVKPLRRNVSDTLGEVPVEYPIRFSIGLQNVNYYNFTGRDQTILRPVVRLTLF